MLFSPSCFWPWYFITVKETLIKRVVRTLVFHNSQLVFYNIHFSKSLNIFKEKNTLYFKLIFMLAYKVMCATIIILIDVCHYTCIPCPTAYLCVSLQLFPAPVSPYFSFLITCIPLLSLFSTSFKISSSSNDPLSSFMTYRHM